MQASDCIVRYVECCGTYFFFPVDTLQSNSDVISIRYIQSRKYHANPHSMILSGSLFF